MAASDWGSTFDDWGSTFDTVLRDRLRASGYVQPLEPDLNLASCGIDSLALVALIVELESALGIEIPAQLMVVENFTTVGGLRSTFARAPDLTEGANGA